MRYKYGSKKRKPTQLLIFDRVKRHLLRQGRRAGGVGMCVYRTKEGLRCAVGCLISKKNYRPNLEGGVDAGVVAAVEKTIGREITESIESLLLALQRVHDSTHPSRWREELRAVRRRVVAGDYGAV